MDYKRDQKQNQCEQTRKKYRLITLQIGQSAPAPIVAPALHSAHFLKYQLNTSSCV